MGATIHRPPLRHDDWIANLDEFAKLHRPTAKPKEDVIDKCTRGADRVFAQIEVLGGNRMVLVVWRQDEPWLNPCVVIHMTAYLANHQKKQRIFEKRERELTHAIKNAYSAERLALAAEKLRSAKISVFKCRFSADGPVQPHQFHAEEIAKRNPQLERWLSMATEEIIDLYSPSTE